MLDKLGAMFSIIFGLAFSVFHKPMAHYAVNAWRKRINILTPSETMYRIFFLAGGIIFMILGILSFFGIIKSK